MGEGEKKGLGKERKVYVMKSKGGLGEESRVPFLQKEGEKDNRCKPLKEQGGGEGKTGKGITSWA